MGLHCLFNFTMGRFDQILVTDKQNIGDGLTGTVLFGNGLTGFRVISLYIPKRICTSFLLTNEFKAMFLFLRTFKSIFFCHDL